MKEIFKVKVFSNNDKYANHCDVYLCTKQMSTNEMQDIATSNNCSETAFIIEHAKFYILRIFSPKQEMLSCTHAILASLYVFYRVIKSEGNKLYFHRELLQGEVSENEVKINIEKITKESLDLRVNKQEEYYVFSKAYLWTSKTASGLQRLMIRKGSLQEVVDFNVDVISAIDSKLPTIESYFLYSETDENNDHFYGRMFAPKLGIKEDPVNGNSCIALFSMQRITNPDVCKITFIQNTQASFTIEEESGLSTLKAHCYLN